VQDAFEKRIRAADRLLRTGRTDEAERQFQDVVAEFPDAVQGVAGLARIAQQRQDWPAALDRWERVLALAPDDLRARLQHASLLLRAGRAGEARDGFLRILERDPHAVHAHAGLMRIARVQARWEELLGAARAVSARCGPHDALFAQAAHAAVLALVRLNRFEEAEEEAGRLAGTGLSREDRFLLTATVLEEQQRWQDTLAWYRRHEGIALARPQTLLRYLHVLLRCGFPSQAYAVFKRYLRGHPRGLDDGRRVRLVIILDRIGKEELAARWLSMLVTSRGPGILTENSFALLATARLKAGQVEPLLSLIRRIEADDSLSARAVKLRLAAVFYEALARHLGEHHMLSRRASPSRPAGRDFRVWDRIAERTRDLRGRDGYGHTAAALERFARFYRRLEARVPAEGLLLNTFCNPWECYGVVQLLLDRIRRRQPSSLIRLGDCEGMFLPYPASDEEPQDRDREAVGYHWWERRLGPEESGRVSREMMRAMEEADLLGIPEPARVIVDLPVPTPPDPSALGRHLRGLRNIFHHLDRWVSGEGTVRFRPDALTAGYVNLDLELWGGYDLILQAARRCSVISSHPHMARALARRFGVDVGQAVLIPSEEKYRHRSPGCLQAPHFPAFFDELRRSLTVAEPGELFLVAAGILGKSYCAWIKQRGGIALDVGSVADLWCGFRTRRDVMHARVSLGRAIRERAGKPPG